MKIFKRIFVGLVVAMLILSSILMTACGNGNSTAKSVLDSIYDFKLRSISGELNVSVDDGLDQTLKDGNVITSNKLSDAKEWGEWKDIYRHFISGSIKANYADGDADIVYKYMQPDGEQSYSHDYIYCFLRDWDSFVEKGVEEIDFDEHEFWRDSDNIFDYEFFDAAWIEKLARFNHVFIYLGNATDSVESNGDKLTVDLNKTAYELISGIKEFINGLKPTTTTGDILSDKTISTIISSIVNMFTPQEALDIAVKMLTGANNEYKSQYDNDIFPYYNDVMNILGEIKPDKNSTTFEYLVKLLTDDKTYDLVSKILKEEMDVVLPAALDKITLSFLADTFNLYELLDEVMYDIVDHDIYEQHRVSDFASMKKELQYIVETFLGKTTVDKFFFELRNGDYYRHELVANDAFVEYTLDENQIADMRASAKISMTDDRETTNVVEREDGTYVTEGTGEINRSVMIMTATAQLKFASEKQALQIIKERQQAE